MTVEEQMKPLREVYPQYDIGAETYGGLHIFNYGEKLSIGAYCSIGFGVKVLLGGEHRTEWVSTFPFSELWPEAKGALGHPQSRGKTEIGNDVWIGAEAMILSGVTIGDGAVIAARALIRSDVLPYSIVGGNPARQIRFRFEQHQRERLLAIKWWTWPRERIVKALPLILAPDVEGFLVAVENGLL